MKKTFLLASLLAISLASTAAYAQAWPPDLATIKKLEAGIQPDDHQKSGSKLHDLSDYARYYAGYIEGGHRLIAGRFITHRWAGQKAAGIYIVVNREKLPVIFDGGCSVVSLVYDVDTAKLLSLDCNGVA
jgi:hypothetical protein